jgi:hypothetical protein
MRLYEPRPRVHFARLDEVSSATPTRYWREGRGNPTASQHVNRITSPDLHLTTSGEISKTLSQEHQSFARELESAQECFIEDEDRGRIRMGRHGWIVIT